LEKSVHGQNRDPWEGLRGNLLLGSLPPHDALVIAPHLVRVHLDGGATLTMGDAVGQPIYFPETAVACFNFPVIDSTGFGVGVVGCEGVLGWSQLVGGDPGQQVGQVQLSGGSALRIDSARLIGLSATNPGLLSALLRYAYLLSLQLAGTLVSNLRDPLHARLCRWLLMFHDRLHGDELAITHDALGRLLGVRRATVTDALHVLEGERLVRCTRGCIAVRDRAALQARAGAAYGAAEAAYSAIVAPFGKPPVRSTSAFPTR
jgi:hypothetical protein